MKMLRTTGPAGAAIALLFSVGCSGGSDTGVGDAKTPNDPTTTGTSTETPSSPPGAASATTEAPEPPIAASSPIVELPNGVEERRIMQLVAPAHLEELDRLIGRYARGEARIYEGTFNARDNMGTLGSTYKDGVIANASVNASLAWEDKLYWDGQMVSGWALTVRSATHRIRIAQSPSASIPAGTSALTIVVPNNSGGGMTGTCTGGCVPDLLSTSTAPASPSITISNVVANGKWGDGRLLQVTASGSLTRVPTSQLTFDRIVLVVDPSMDGSTIGEFKTASDNNSEMVRSVERNYSEPTAIPSGMTFYSCERVTSYKLDWFVDRQHLLHYGLRAMSISSAQTCCSEGPPGACAPRTCF